MIPAALKRNKKTAPKLPSARFLISSLEEKSLLAESLAHRFVSLVVLLAVLGSRSRLRYVRAFAGLTAITGRVASVGAVSTSGESQNCEH
jgi:hypothetical protein